MTCCSAAPILPEQAKDHIGENASVRGLVEQVSFSKNGNGFLFGGRWPQQVFTGFVPARSLNPANAAASAKLEPDFHHLNACKLVKQLPWGLIGGAGFEFVLEAHPQAVSQEGDHNVGFDPLGGEAPDRADSQVALERAEDGFRLL